MGKAWITGPRGAYKVRWRDGTKNPKTGKLIAWSSETFEKLGDAQAEKDDRDDQLVIKRRARRRAGAAPMPLLEIVERFIAERTGDGKLAESTAAEYREAINRLVKATRWKSVTDLTRETVKAWKTLKQGRGVSRPLAYLRSILNWAESELDQAVDPKALEAMSVARIASRDEAERPAKELYTQEQLHRCFERADSYGPDTGIMARYLAKYGARPRTAARLLVGDFTSRAGEGMLTLRKLKNGRTITHPVDEATVAMFDRLASKRSPSEPLFRDIHGGPWPLNHRQKPDTMCKWWERRIAYDLPRSLRGIYDLKRYAITTMLANGIDLATITRFTGHKDVRSLLRYLRTNHIVAQNAFSKLPVTGIYVPPKALSEGAL